jgi:deoxyadenosine/deoxycytidine kinase
MKIIIDGLIGSGKSTLLNNLTVFGIPKFQEPVNKFTLLKDFYNSPNLHAFALQKQVIEVLKNSYQGDLIITERCINTSLNVFAQLLYKQGYLSQSELRNLYESEEKYNHDLYIFLKVSPEEAITRIKKRGRESEQNISYEYIKELYYQYEDYIATLKSRGCMVFEVEAETHEFNHIIKAVYKILDKHIYNTENEKLIHVNIEKDNGMLKGLQQPQLIRH